MHMNYKNDASILDAPGAARRRTGVVVVGAGQAGLSLSYHLGKLGVPHLVLERDRPFSAWENRWEGFRTNTPNWMNTLPMLPPDVFPSDDGEAFATREELLDYLHRCLAAVDPPIEVGVEVQNVSQRGDHWEVDIGDEVLEASSVAICNGAMSTARKPAAAATISQRIPQIHSSEYRSPGQIETRRVLVVGSASSGVQICRLLAESGRFDEISMAVSRVTTLPHRTLGVQTHRFLHKLGLFDVRSRSLLGRLMYSGLESKGDPIMRPAPRDLARRFGVELYPKFSGLIDGLLVFADGRIMTSDHLTIVWCTGFRGDFGFIDVERPDEAFDSVGSPVHTRGVVDSAPGLYFVGLRYQHTVASHDLYGVGADASHIAEQIHERWRRSHTRAGRHRAMGRR